MAFTVEDGTGVAGANSLVDVAFADEYFADRGNTVWAALTEEQKQSALILASDYASTQYRYKTACLSARYPLRRHTGRGTLQKPANRRGRRLFRP